MKAAVLSTMSFTLGISLLAQVSGLESFCCVPALDLAEGLCLEMVLNQGGAVDISQQECGHSSLEPGSHCSLLLLCMLVREESRHTPVRLLSPPKSTA